MVPAQRVWSANGLCLCVSAHRLVLVEAMHARASGGSWERVRGHQPTRPLHLATAAVGTCNILLRPGRWNIRGAYPQLPFLSLLQAPPNSHAHAIPDCSYHGRSCREHVPRTRTSC